MVYEEDEQLFSIYSPTDSGYEVWKRNREVRQSNENSRRGENRTRSGRETERVR